MRTDRHEKRIISFRNYAKAPKMKTLKKTAIIWKNALWTRSIPVKFSRGRQSSKLCWEYFLKIMHESVLKISAVFRVLITVTNWTLPEHNWWREIVLPLTELAYFFKHRNALEARIYACNPYLGGFINIVPADPVTFGCFAFSSYCWWRTLTYCDRLKQVHETMRLQ